MRKQLPRRQQSGFTLVEIAIVLVIIGLLLGGILKGQELINSAKAKSFAQDFRNVQTALAMLLSSDHLVITLVDEPQQPSVGQ